MLAWSDANQAKYWVYRSIDGGATFSWIGRTLGPTTFTDTTPVVGAKYQVHYQGIPRVDCIVDAEPDGANAAFNCRVDAGQLSWTDAEQTKYWVYRSIDDGSTFSWIGRTFGATVFADPRPVVGAKYQVHYQGIPRVDCAVDAEPSAADAFGCEVDGANVSMDRRSAVEVLGVSVHR